MSLWPSLIRVFAATPVRTATAGEKAGLTPLGIHQYSLVFLSQGVGLSGQLHGYLEEFHVDIEFVCGIHGRKVVRARLQCQKASRSEGQKAYQDAGCGLPWMEEEDTGLDARG